MTAVAETPPSAPAPADAPELDVLLARTRRYLWQSVTEVARPPFVEAGRWVGRRMVALVVGLVTLAMACVLLLGGGVLLVAQYVPLWVAALSGGGVAALVALVALGLAGRR